MSRRHPITEVRSCETCKNCERTTVFELCKHEQSRYAIAGKVDFHTTGHMRSNRGPCGEDGTLHTP